MLARGAVSGWGGMRWLMKTIGREYAEQKN